LLYFKICHFNREFLKYGASCTSVSKNQIWLVIDISELHHGALLMSDTVIITLVFTFPHHMLGLLFKSISCGLVLKNDP